MKTSPTRQPQDQQTVNAFQFMMDSRTKVIGRNSPGKSPGRPQISPEISKPVSARKNLLSEWADAKGASKRKRDEEERGKCIEDKLEKRAKKLRDLLKVVDLTGDVENVETLNKNKHHGRGRKKKHVDKWKLKIKLADNCLTPPDSQDCGEVIVATEEVIVATEPEVTIELDESVDLIDEQASDGIPLRRSSRRTKAKNYYNLENGGSDDEFEKKLSKPEKPRKVAPVFLKMRQKVDPKVAEARREFLMSGIPTEVKKELTKIVTNTEEAEFDVFPTISHIQQQSPGNPFWNLSPCELNLSPITRFNDSSTLTKWSLSRPENLTADKVQFLPTNSTKSIKIKVKQIKSQNPQCPVNKSYNFINIKCKNNDAQMWPEKYRPITSADFIIGNNKGVAKLREWLQKWVNVKKTNDESDFDSDFDTSDSNSRDSYVKSRAGRNNVVILNGPPGCGKSSAVYATCGELNFNILEVNASSRRTGKWLLQELQEATQSHQVPQRQLSFFDEKKRLEAPRHRVVLLVEDVDLVFEQDEGFIAALSQIALTSKRPIVLTTNDAGSPLIQKFLNNHRQINFGPVTGTNSVIWLQILCLVDGRFDIDKQTIEGLISHFNGDIRRTLLQLQFFVTSGGNFKPLGDQSKSTLDHKSLSQISNSLDDLSYCDIITSDSQKYGSKIQGLRMTDRKFKVEPKSGLELTEQVTHFDSVSAKQTSCDIRDALLAPTELLDCETRSFVKEMSATSQILEQIVPCFDQASSDVSLDYLAAIRDMIKSETERTVNNEHHPRTRRGCYNSHLRNLGLNCRDDVYKAAISAFNR